MNSEKTLILLSSGIDNGSEKNPGLCSLGILQMERTIPFLLNIVKQNPITIVYSLSPCSIASARILRRKLCCPIKFKPDYFLWPRDPQLNKKDENGEAPNIRYYFDTLKKTVIKSTTDFIIGVSDFEYLTYFYCSCKFPKEGLKDIWHGNGFVFQNGSCAPLIDFLKN